MRGAALTTWLLGALALGGGVLFATRVGPKPAQAEAKPEEVALLPFVPPTTGRVVALDAGHGAPGNTGNRSCLCEREEDFTMRFTKRVSLALATRGFTPVLLRDEGERVPYGVRIERAALAGARALVSFHSDIRAVAERGFPYFCGEDRSSPGFTVIWSDERAGSD